MNGQSSPFSASKSNFPSTAVPSLKTCNTPAGLAQNMIRYFEHQISTVGISRTWTVRFDILVSRFFRVSSSSSSCSCIDVNFSSACRSLICTAWRCFVSSWTRSWDSASWLSRDETCLPSAAARLSTFSKLSWRASSSAFGKSTQQQYFWTILLKPSN